MRNVRPFRRALRAALPIVLILLLTACAPSPERPALEWRAPDWSSWQLGGRVSVTLGDDGWHASLSWEQHPQTYAIRLLGPLGQGGVELDGDVVSASLRASDGTRLQAADAEQLLYDATGWRLPVSGLRYWVMARAVPDTPMTLRSDELGRPSLLEQSGWNIRYSRYERWAGYWLPKRIDLDREGLRVRVLVDQWAPLVKPGS